MLRIGNTVNLSSSRPSRRVLRPHRLVVGVGLAAAVLVGSMAFVLRPGHSEDVASRAPEWLDDLRAALAAAGAEKKDVLLEFSRSEPDSKPGETLESKLLDQEPFRRSLGKTFVLLRMVPSSRMSPARITEVATCAQRLGIERFPTFILLDSRGRPYARSERVAADVAGYEQEFARLSAIRLERDKFVALAAEAKGADRARYLDRALKVVAPFADSEYTDLEAEIVKLDAQNAAGLKSKYDTTVAYRRIDAAIQNEVYPLIDRGNYKAALARIDRLISETKPPRPQLQLLVAFKGQLYYSLGEKKRAAQFLDQAIALDPTSESAQRARSARLQVEGSR